MNNWVILKHLHCNREILSVAVVEVEWEVAFGRATLAVAARVHAEQLVALCRSALREGPVGAQLQREVSLAAACARKVKE